ncbi:MAG: hypothetical protein ACKVH8_06900 [Pirellulales bacterium]
MSNSSFDPNNQTSEIELTALLYLSNELSEAEFNQFEDLLVSSQAAREVLADSVELIQSTYACQDSLQPSTSLRPKRSASYHDSLKSKLGWISVGVAACLVGVFSVSSFFPNQNQIDPSTTTASHSSADTDQLAQLWIDYTQNPDHLANADRDPILDLNSDLDFTDEIAFDTDMEQLTSTPPDWMLAAFTSTDDSDMEMGETSEEMIP